MFDFFKRKKAKIACVYAGPMYYRNKTEKAPDTEFEDVYAGPGPDPEPEENDNTAEYPANHEENNVTYDTTCNSAEESDKQPKAETSPYPESAKEENADQKQVEPMRCVYAAPQFMNRPEEVFSGVYAGPRTETPMFGIGATEPQTQETTEPQPSLEEQKIEKWKCSCGAENIGIFCKVCGSVKGKSNTWMV